MDTGATWVRSATLACLVDAGVERSGHHAPCRRYVRITIPVELPTDGGYGGAMRVDEAAVRRPIPEIDADLLTNPAKKAEMLAALG
jgi:hypothetical protein